MAFLLCGLARGRAAPELRSGDKDSMAGRKWSIEFLIELMMVQEWRRHYEKL